MTLFLLVFIHVLSVRSGLLVLYLALLVWLLRYVFLTRRWAVAAALGIMLVLLPAAAYQTFPSFRNKLAYARWDLLQHQQGTGANYSDSDRLTSWKAGWEVGKKNPLFGVGAGDLKRGDRPVLCGHPPGDRGRKTAAQPVPHGVRRHGAARFRPFCMGIFLPAFLPEKFQRPPVPRLARGDIRFLSHGEYH